MEFKLITADVEVSQIHRLFDSCPNTPTIDTAHNLIFGAFDGTKLVAVTDGTYARKNKKRVLWSNFLMVDPEYRRRGIAFGLKQFQRSWALNKHYTAIVWTFNPFETGLANFYFHHLGATANALHINAENCLSVDQPLYSLEVIWRLKDQRVKALAAKKQPANPISFEAARFSLAVGENGQPVTNPMPFDPTLNPICRIEIPSATTDSKQFGSVEMEVWYQALNDSLGQGFLKKYTVSDFKIGSGRCWYVLTAPIAWFLYVLECNDHTLYTGITPDLNRRLKLHNAGRGALYTASRSPVHFIATWKYPDRIAAMRAEIAFKRLSRQKKLQHINSELDFCGVQFLSPAHRDSV